MEVVCRGYQCFSCHGAQSQRGSCRVYDTSRTLCNTAVRQDQHEDRSNRSKETALRWEKKIIWCYATLPTSKAALLEQTKRAVMSLLGPDTNTTQVQFYPDELMVMDPEGRHMATILDSVARCNKVMPWTGGCKEDCCGTTCSCMKTNLRCTALCCCNDKCCNPWTKL